MSGFVPDPGKDFSGGDLPEISKRLDQLGRQLGVTIYGLSGYRTPAYSVSVGGFANDPHTQHKAADIGVNSQMRASAGSITDAQLASVGLYRPFAGAQEINHVQLRAGGANPSNFLAPSSGGGSFPLDPTQLPSGAGKGAAVVPDAATAAAKALVGLVVDAIGRDGARVLLSVALVIAGLALIAFGASRAFGLRTPPLPALAALAV